MDVLFSVVVPTFNYGHLLPRTLDSVLQQDRDDVEIIVVDDASTDDTQQVLSRYADRVHVLRLDQNSGPATAWSRGLAIARGTYVCKLDADDWQLPGCLQRFAQAFALDPEIGIVAASVRIHPDGSADTYLEPVTATDRTLSAQEFRRQLLGGFFFRMPGVCIRREALTDHAAPRPDLRLPHDWEYFLRTTRGWRCHLVAEPAAVYRIHSGSLTTTSGASDHLLGDYRRLLSAVRDPGDPAFLEGRDARRLRRGMARTYLATLAPHMGLGDPRGAMRQLLRALRIAGPGPANVLSTIGAMTAITLHRLRRRLLPPHAELQPVDDFLPGNRLVDGPADGQAI